MEANDAKDFTELTCTNLMIRLKILLNKVSPGDAVTFYATREQVDNTCSPFSGQGYRSPGPKLPRTGTWFASGDERASLGYRIRQRPMWWAGERGRHECYSPPLRRVQALEEELKESQGMKKWDERTQRYY